MEITESWKRKNVDRLSSLPDDILIHILDFLPIKIYVATSILGRRWRFLWARVPNLDFDDEYFDDDDDAGANSFSSIVNRVMFLHNRQNIISFRLRQSELSKCACGDYEFEKWITKAIECNIQELDLSLSWMLKLPKCIFTCKTLVKLSFFYFDMPIIGTVYLPALKKLQLDQVYFESVECFHHLLSGCPGLNEFIMYNSEIIKDFMMKDSKRENKEICISLPTINRLELEINYDLLYPCSKRKVYRLKYDTPALKYLKFNNDVPKNYSLVSRFAFSASAETFHNLTDIELEADWRFFPSFLEKANNLEVLTIHCCYCLGFADNTTYWIDPEQVPACLVSHLGTVRIRGFGCKEQEFKVVRYILRNAKVLRRMEIYTGGIRKNDLNKQLEALKRISLFERGSETCQLAFD